MFELSCCSSDDKMTTVLSAVCGRCDEGRYQRYFFPTFFSVTESSHEKLNSVLQAFTEVQKNRLRKWKQQVH